LREAGWSTDQPDSDQPKPSEKDEKQEPKKPKPRTIWQALRLYRCCLGCPECFQEKDKGSGEGSGSGSNHSNGSGSSSGEPRASAGSGSNASGSGSGSDCADNGVKKDEEPEVAWFSAHAQSTMVTQYHDHFHSPYLGPNSLLPSERAATTATGTIFLAARLRDCCDDTTDIVFNPEFSSGSGLSGTKGMAGFPNGEATRAGTIEPTPYVARLFLRQTWGLGGKQEKVEDDANQIAGMRDVDRLTVLVGKMSAGDLVDNNKYSHDPRNQFLNWSLMDNGAWDYPANARGYSYGIGIEANEECSAFRYGIFLEPAEANSPAFDSQIMKALGEVWEWEDRWKIGEHPGAIRYLAYLNHAHMGKYRDALALAPVNPDITTTREYRIKYGFGINFEQELTKDLGVWARWGWNDGQSESWAFTEIDNTVAAGLALKGRRWCRPGDTVGLALVSNGLSDAHMDYLAASGVGFIVGDGALNYAREDILETYYDFEFKKGIHFVLDLQGVEHPAYNADRGPLVVWSMRAHFEF
jgi:high affinity Mn2+ porin